MTIEVKTIKEETHRAVSELFHKTGVRPGEILVVGCSTSEVLGERIGSAGSAEVAESILGSLAEECAAAGVYVAIQCCEHLNRALVVEEETALRYHLEPVMVVPVPKAGGALAAQAMKVFKNPVVVENIQAHAGLDIGSTLIGMHLKVVAVPVRLEQKILDKHC